MNGLLLTFVIAAQSPLNAIDAAAMTDFKGELVPLPAALAAFSKSAGVTMKANAVMSARKVDVGFDKVPMRSAMKALEVAVGGTWTFDGKDLILVESEKERADRAKELARRAAERKKSVEFVLAALRKYAGKSEEELEEQFAGINKILKDLSTPNENVITHMHSALVIEALVDERFREFIRSRLRQNSLNESLFAIGNVIDQVVPGLDSDKQELWRFRSFEGTVYFSAFDSSGQMRASLFMPLDHEINGFKPIENYQQRKVDSAFLLSKGIEEYEVNFRKPKWYRNVRSAFDFLDNARKSTSVSFVSEAFRKWVREPVDVEVVEVWRRVGSLLEANVWSVDGIAVPIRLEADDFREDEIPESAWAVLESKGSKDSDPPLQAYIDFAGNIPSQFMEKYLDDESYYVVSTVSTEPLKHALLVLKMLAQQNEDTLNRLFEPTPITISKLNLHGNWFSKLFHLFLDNHIGYHGFLTAKFFRTDLPELALFLDRKAVFQVTTEYGSNIKVTDTSPDAALSKNATKETQYTFYLGYGIDSSIQYSFTLRNP